MHELAVLAETRREGRPNGAVLLMLASAALWSALFSLTAVNRAKDVAVHAVLHGEPVAPRALLGALGPLDGLVAALAAASVAALLAAEWRRRAVSEFLRTCTPGQAFLALTIAAAWTGHAYLSPGILLGGETGTHVSRFLEVGRGLQGGTLPTWTNDQYLGEPLLWFTGPLTYVVGGVLTLLTGGDAVAASRVFLFACHMAGAWLFFLFLRRLDMGPTASLVGAAGFAGCFAHLHLFLYRGVFPQALTIAFLVLLFHTAEGLARGRGGRGLNWLGFALATAGLITNHQPHALFAAVYLGLYGGVSLLLGRWRWRAMALPLMVLAGAAGVAIAALAVLPVAVEGDWVLIERTEPLFNLQVSSARRLAQLVLWRNTRTNWAMDYWAYLGTVTAVLAGLGAWQALRGRAGREQRALACAALACFAVGLFLYNPVVRDILFLFFFAGILAALGTEALTGAAPRWRGALPLAVALLALDLASTSVQPVARTDRAYQVEAGQALERRAPNERIVEVFVGADGSFSADIGPDGSPTGYAALVQRTAGNHNMAATHAHNYLAATVKLAEDDLRRDGALSPPTRRLLEMLNVTRIVCFSPVAAGCPARFAGARSEDSLGATIRLDGAPVLFGRTLRALPPPPSFDKPMLWPHQFARDNPLVAARIAGIDTFLAQVAAVEAPDGQRIAGALAVRALDAGEAPAQAGAWTPHLVAYTVDLERVSLRIESDGDGYAQLAHPWFPATIVRVNGQRIAPLQGATDLMVVPIHRGISEIEITPSTTSVRTASVWISALALLATLAAAGIMTHRDRRRRPATAAPFPA